MNPALLNGGNSAGCSTDSLAGSALSVDIAVQRFVQETANYHALIDGDAFGFIHMHLNGIPGFHDYLHKEDIATLDMLHNQLSYMFNRNHFSSQQNRELKAP